MKREDWIFLSTFIVALVIIFILQDKTSQRLDDVEALHCEMVKLWTDSAGDKGWPDYNNTADKCKIMLAR